jgi:hypothetical protein
VQSPKIEKEYEPYDWKGMCHEITRIRDSDIGGQKEKFFNFASGEATKKIGTIHLRVYRWHIRRHGGQTFIDQFGVSWVEELKVQHPYSRIREV